MRSSQSVSYQASAARGKAKFTMIELWLAACNPALLSK